MRGNGLIVVIALLCCVLFVDAARKASRSSGSSSKKATESPQERSALVAQKFQYGDFVYLGDNNFTKVITFYCANVQNASIIYVYACRSSS